MIDGEIAERVSGRVRREEAEDKDEYGRENERASLPCAGVAGELHKFKLINFSWRLSK